MTEQEVARLVVRLVVETGDLKKGVDQARGELQGFATKAGGILRGLAGAAAGYLGFQVIKQFTTDIVRAAQESEIAERRIESVVRATGAAAGYSADQFKIMASEIQDSLGIEDEAVLNTISVLATFRNVQGPIFREAIDRIYDMAQVMGMDARSGAIQLGKALNDPIQGVSALTRVGITFTEGQKQQIKTLVESGHTMDAQRIILAELAKEFGGSAKDAMETFEGSTRKVSLAWGDLREELGKTVTESKDTRDFLDWWADRLKTITGFVRELREGGGFTALFDPVWLANRSVAQLGGPNRNALPPEIPWMGTEIAGVKPAGIDTSAALAALKERLKKTGPLEDAQRAIDRREEERQRDLADNLGMIMAREDERQVAAEISKQEKKDHLQVEGISKRLKGEREYEIEREKMAADAILADQERQAEIIRTEQKHADEQLRQADKLSKVYRDLYTDFAKGMGDAFASAIVDGRNFADTMNALFKDLARSLISYGVSTSVAGLFSFLMPTPAAPVKKAAGGYLSGGSGTQDDLLLLGMGGEYVQPKRAVSYYGRDVMDAMRSGVSRDRIAGMLGGEALAKGGTTNVIENRTVQLRVSPEIMGMTLKDWFEGYLARELATR